MRERLYNTITSDIVDASDSLVQKIDVKYQDIKLKKEERTYNKIVSMLRGK